MLSLASDHRRVEVTGDCLRAGSYVQQPPRAQRLCLTLCIHRAGELGRDCIRQKAMRDIADQDHSGLGGLFQSRGDVDGVAGDERVA